MTPPTVRVNTFFQVQDKKKVDTITKLFIICQFIFGVNRLPILWTNRHITFMILSVTYTAILIFFSLYCSLLPFDLDKYPGVGMVIIIVAFIQYSFVTTCSFFRRGRLQTYLYELNAFDKYVDGLQTIRQGSFVNLVFMFGSISYCSVLVCLSFIYADFETFYLPLIPAVVTHILEMYLYGHLFSLLIPRIRFLNSILDQSLGNFKNKIVTKPQITRDNISDTSKSKKEIDIVPLVNLYHILLKAHDYLADAIKWQLLNMLIMSFVNSLIHSYYLALSIIREKNDLNSFVSYLGEWLIIILPLFSPCILAGRVKDEVVHFRELLSEKLYGNQLDKGSRTVARALLAWTETHDLSFSLLRILDIDISLPFKYVGLHVTYLIILLQFEKVMNP